MSLVLTSTEFVSTHMLVATFLCCGKVLASIEFVRTQIPLVKGLTPNTPTEKNKKLKTRR